jgi:hypothetical protein
MNGGHFGKIKRPFPRAFQNERAIPNGRPPVLIKSCDYLDDTGWGIIRKIIRTS